MTVPPSRIIQLTFCRIEIFGDYCMTLFPDGTSYGAFPHDTPDYRALARRLGYGDDIKAYSDEHEFCHSFLPQELEGRASAVLWPLAHGRMGPVADILAEEALVVMFQGFLRADVPMAATAPGVRWWTLREKARALLEVGAPAA